MPTETRGGLALAVDADSRILVCLRDDLGLGAETVVGRPFASLLDRSSLQRAVSLFRDISEGTPPAHCDLLVRTPQEEVRTLYFSGTRFAEHQILLVATPSPDALPDYYHRLLTVAADAIRDRGPPPPSPTVGMELDELSRMNNELINAQRELARTNARLARADRAKNRLLGMAAHDLRNPLGAIRIMADLLSDPKTELSEDRRRELIGRIQESSGFMLRLVEDILDLAALESGQLHLHRSEVDLGLLIRATVEVQRALAEPKSITIDVDVEPGLPRANADANKVEQVVSNLIGNAIKFSPEGASIAVEARLDSGDSRTGDEEDGDRERLVICVEDEGPGIPADELDELFQAFTRTSVPASAGERGTGLGLAIARRIVEEHGGRIWCESAVGAGSTFRFTLPPA